MILIDWCKKFSPRFGVNNTIADEVLLSHELYIYGQLLALSALPVVVIITRRKTRGLAQVFWIQEHPEADDDNKAQINQAPS